MNAAHDLYTHREDGRVCVLVEDGTWFVPYDAGGEGFSCERQHGPAPAPVVTSRRALEAALRRCRVEDGAPVGLFRESDIGHIAWTLIDRGIFREEAAVRAEALLDARAAWVGGEATPVMFNRAKDDLTPQGRVAKWLRERADAEGHQCCACYTNNGLPCCNRGHATLAPQDSAAGEADERAGGRGPGMTPR